VLIQKDQKQPVTLPSLIRDLRKLGLAPGMNVLVHSSLSSLGWVCGGAVAVILALEEILRPYGTLIMPTHTAELSEPSNWRNPSVSRAWYDTIRAQMPPFDPEFTPSQTMGTIAETFRKQPEVLRSVHPQFSFAAWGQENISLLHEHSLDFGLGEASPLARLYALDGHVLLLGVDHSKNTSLHLAEYRADYPAKKIVDSYAPLRIGGHRRWLKFMDININSEDFGSLGKSFNRNEKARIMTGNIGLAASQLFPQRLCVDYAVGWFEKNRR
jgi:aminoglycoside 3-N-acetyltransferase